MRTLSFALTGAEANCMQCFVSTKPAKWPYYTTYSVISSRVTVGSGISCDYSDNEGPGVSGSSDYSQFPIR